MTKRKKQKTNKNYKRRKKWNKIKKMKDEEETVFFLYFVQRQSFVSECIFNNLFSHNDITP